MCRSQLASSTRARRKRSNLTCAPDYDAQPSNWPMAQVGTNTGMIRCTYIYSLAQPSDRLNAVNSCFLVEKLRRSCQPPQRATLAKIKTKQWSRKLSFQLASDRGSMLLQTRSATASTCTACLGCRVDIDVGRCSCWRSLCHCCRVDESCLDFSCQVEESLLHIAVRLG